MSRPFLAIFIAIIALGACKKTPVEIIGPDPVVSYKIADTMHLSPITITSFPELYNNYNDKTYFRETNKVKSYYSVEGADVYITFEDTSVSNLGTDLSIKIPNKGLLNISGQYSAPIHDVFYKWRQATSASSSVFSVGHIKADSCNIQIEYDEKTKTLSGSITKLKYPIGVYIPFYLPGSAVTPGPNDKVFLTSGGSFRQHAITFQYMKSI